MKEVNQKRLHNVWFQPHDVLEKAKIMEIIKYQCSGDE